MLDKALWLARWIVGVVVGAVLALWLVAVLFALAGFRKTAEALNDLFVVALPVAGGVVGLLHKAVEGAKAANGNHYQVRKGAFIEGDAG